MNEQSDPLMLKLRTTLFEIKRKSHGKVKGRPTQGPLLGVTLMTKRYKSKRRLEPTHNSQNNQGTRQNDQNSLKTQIFRRIVVSQPKRGHGLEIQKAVIHGTQPKKQRVSTQKSSENVELSQYQHFSREYLLKRLSKNRKPLNSYRQNQAQMRNTCFKACAKVVHSERPFSAYTQPFLRMGQEKNKSMEMQLVKKLSKNEEINGWNVENQEDFDFL